MIPKKKADITNHISIDTLSAQKFFIHANVCSLALAKGFTEIKPPMIPWATDTSDPYSESYLIEGKKLKIIQPLKFDSADSVRRYFYDDKIMRTTRILFDSLDFNFNSITFDYGASPRDIFKNKTYVLLRNEPRQWSGTANRYRFIQLFDLQKLICYEFFVDYYACLK